MYGIKYQYTRVIWPPNIQIQVYYVSEFSTNINIGLMLDGLLDSKIIVLRNVSCIKCIRFTYHCTVIVASFNAHGSFLFCKIIINM